MKKWNSQSEHGHQMEQTRGLFCTCKSGVARCQLQHQWRRNSMFERVARASELYSSHSNFLSFMGL